MTAPFYEEPGVAIYRGRVEEVLPTLDPKRFALAIADPPWGVCENTARKSAGRGANGAFWRGNKSRDFPPCDGDDQPFDPAPILHLQRLLIWGANHFAERLPPSASWWVWDKRDGGPSDDNGDCELAWSNLGGPPRLLSHKWRGLIKASEKSEPKIHPMQKPIALGEWIIGGRSKVGEEVLVLYAGGGADVVAAKRLRRRVVAIECSERYCEEIVKRVKRAAVTREQLTFAGAR